MAFHDLPDQVKAEYERIGKERERASRETDRLYRRELLRVCVEVVVWTVLGLAMSGVAFALADYDIAMMFLYAGMVVNSGGVIITLWAAYRRGEERGDW